MRKNPVQVYAPDLAPATTPMPKEEKKEEKKPERKSTPERKDTDARGPEIPRGYRTVALQTDEKALVDPREGKDKEKEEGFAAWQRQAGPHLRLRQPAGDRQR